jgi:hypothetical protein
MKLISLALVVSLAVAGYVQAQTPAQTPTPAPAASSGGKVSSACKKEIKALCGRAHGDEMQSCVKSNLDMNKFSADCKTELAKPPAKPSS